MDPPACVPPPFPRPSRLWAECVWTRLPCSPLRIVLAPSAALAHTVHPTICCCLLGAGIPHLLAEGDSFHILLGGDVLAKTSLREQGADAASACDRERAWVTHLRKRPSFSSGHLINSNGSITQVIWVMTLPEGSAAKRAACSNSTRLAMPRACKRNGFGSLPGRGRTRTCSIYLLVTQVLRSLASNFF